MSKPEHFLALFHPTISALLTGTGFYLWLGSGGIISYLGLSAAIAGILSAVLYILKLRKLPDAKLINSPETDRLRVYMRGGLIASFIPNAVAAVYVMWLCLQPSDGVSMVMYIPIYIVVFLLPFVWMPLLFSGAVLGWFIGSPAAAVAIFACFIVRVVTQSACFLATNKRIDYSDSGISGIIGTMFGTINIFFWLGNLSRVKKFAKIELEKGITAQ